jgi:hypothetical protein
MNTLESLAARIAIGEGKARYCRFLDTKQWDAFKALMTEDFELDVTEGTQIPLIRGREQAVEQIRASIGAATTAHQVHQPEMEFHGTDEALVIWPMQDRVLWSAERPSLVGYGHYHERWVKRDGEWKLAALRLTRLHVDFLPPQT